MLNARALHVINNALSFCSRERINSLEDAALKPTSALAVQFYDIALNSCLQTRGWNFAKKRKLQPLVVSSDYQDPDFRYISCPQDFVRLIEIKQREGMPRLIEPSYDADFYVVNRCIEVPNDCFNKMIVTKNAEGKDSCYVTYVSSDTDIYYPDVFSLFLAYRLATLMCSKAKEGLGDISILTQLEQKWLAEAITFDNSQEGNAHIGSGAYINVRA